MSTYLNPLAIEAELNYIKNACTQIVIVASYTVGDSRATVLAAPNVLASLPWVASGSTPANFMTSELSVSISGNARTLSTPAGKSDLIADATGTCTHIILVDGANVLLAAPVISQVITAGNQVNFPISVFTVSQPV